MAARIWVGARCAQREREMVLGQWREKLADRLNERGVTEYHRRLALLSRPLPTFAGDFENASKAKKLRRIYSFYARHVQAVREVVAYFSHVHEGTPYPRPLSPTARKKIAELRLGPTSSPLSRFDPDDFVEALNRLRRILDNKDGRAHPLGRYFRFSQRRLREFRTQLFGEVAAEATEKFGYTVSTRLVETAWEEHKKWENELRADDSSLEHVLSTHVRKPADDSR